MILFTVSKGFWKDLGGNGGQVSILVVGVLLCIMSKMNLASLKMRVKDPRWTSALCEKSEYESDSGRTEVRD